ncbi:MAG: Flp pilus assembly complex ATPase component TadA [Candidatus Omnitrophica bacterium]|nr:Flp pilus assembly complex ATPase component TadA [Candidatus Omnitrophota bacterium]
MPEFIRKRLGERLVEEGFITEDQFQRALAQHKETKVTVRQVMIDMGYITEDRLNEFMASYLDIPYMKNIAEKITDPTFVEVIPEEKCREHMVMPLFKLDNVITVAMADPFDVFTIDALRQITGAQIEPVLAKKDEITQAIDRFFGTKDELQEAVQDVQKEVEELEIIRGSAAAPQTDDEGKQIVVEEGPIIRLVNSMIIQAVAERASDIHVEADESRVRIRYRVDGMLQQAMLLPKHLQVYIVSRIKIMAGMDISIKRAPQDGRFGIKIKDKSIDVRVSSVPTIYDEKVVMRLLDQTSIQIGLDEIGFKGKTLEQFKELINLPHGIVLISGPTGSGKTTTLYVVLQAINAPHKNIITIEDPVEYNLGWVNQIQVNVKAGVTFAAGLRSILRQDPDVIMVGEMRDLETAEISVRAALTGHLVFSTIHTNDAASSMVRMVDMGLEPYLVSASVFGIVAQRLVRTICPKCKEPYKPDDVLLEELNLTGDPNKYTLYCGKGCEHCHEQGYKGRTTLVELMVVNNTLRHMIHQNASSFDLRDAAQKAGMKTLWRDGIEKALAGITTVDEVRKASFTEDE